jgi:hypothetical protein
MVENRSQKTKTNTKQHLILYIILKTKIKPKNTLPFLLTTQINGSSMELVKTSKADFQAAGILFMQGDWI